VEGYPLAARRDNADNHRFQIAQHLTRWNAQRMKATLSKDAVARDVSLGPVAPVMALPINFNGQPRFEAGEVQQIGRLWMLATKAKSARAFAQGLPQEHFWKLHFPARLSRSAHIMDRRAEDGWDPSTVLRTVPLPVPGRN
jgi:hypothetical protein